MQTPLAQLAYLQIGSPDPQASAEFYVEKFGMRIIDQSDGSYFLRSWGDYYKYSLIVSPAEDASLITMTWRTHDAQALEDAATRLQSLEGASDQRWLDPTAHRGKAFQFTGPLGHNMTLVWDLEFYEAPEEFSSVYPDRPEKRSLHAAAPRFLDHVTIASTDVKEFAEWYSNALGFRIMAFTTLEDSPLHVFSVLTTNEKSHDLGIVLDTSTTPGRVHHIAFWVDHPEDLVRTAEIMTENNVPIEYGPSMHGIGEQHFLYFREPSGLRIEVNSGGYRNYVPDWQPKTWLPSHGANSHFRNWDMPDSMMEAFPAANGRTATEQGVSPDLAEEILNPWAKQPVKG